MAEQVSDALDDLNDAHNGYNNFYNEPAFARAVHKLVPRADNVPQEVNKKFVFTVVIVFPANDYVKATGADPIYTAMIEQFSEKQVRQAVLLVSDERISRKLQFSRCGKQFREMLDLIEGKITSPVLQELVEVIRTHAGDTDDLRKLKKVKNLIETINQLTS